MRHWLALGFALHLLTPACSSGDKNARPDVDAAPDVPDADASGDTATNDAVDGGDTGGLSDSTDPDGVDTAGDADGAGETADTGTLDTADAELDSNDSNDGVGEVVSDPCPVVGRHEPCALACGPYQLPMRQCLSSGWDECACLTFGHERVAAGGGSELAGFVDVGAGGRYACYTREGALVLAHQPRGGAWSVQPIGAQGVHCDLAPGAPGSALLAYGASNAPEPGHAFHYREVTGGVLGPVSYAGEVDNTRGVGPRIARAPSGELHAISVEERSSGNGLLIFQLTAGTNQDLEDLQGPPFEQAITVCDDGTQLIAWADMAPEIWVTYIGARVTSSWRSKFLPWEVQYLGQGMALTCRGGRSYGLMQDLSRGELVFFTSATPAGPASYLTYEVPTGGSVGRFNDIQVDHGVLWASWVTAQGDVRLSMRPADLSAEWVSTKVVDRAQIPTGALGGDVELTVGEDGLPALLFFGVLGADEGPWIATLR